MIRLGIDIGGTKMEGIALTSQGEVIARERITTEAHKGYEHVLSQVERLFEKITADHDGDFTLGICTPGALSADTGRLKNSNTQCLIGQPLKEDIESRLGHRVVLENDANCFAQAEALLGAARDYSIVFGVIMGTGVGGGICLDGRIHRGLQYIAGEWGHSLLHPGGNPCYCGKKGCVETYLSGPALERHYIQLTGEELPLEKIVEHPPKTWKEEFLGNFGMALSNVINILDPDVVVLGGGVSNIDFLYHEGPRYVANYCFNNRLETPIVKNQLGDSAGVFGAACLM
ncbi:MAG: ROK family protein [Fidelibacterota bacterium]